MKTGLTYHLNTLLSVLFLSGFLTYYVGQHPRHVGQREEHVQPQADPKIHRPVC